MTAAGSNPRSNTASNTASATPATPPPVTLDQTAQTVAPSDRWLSAAAAFMPPLTGAAGVAERLLLHVHYGIDWREGWVGKYRATYWDQQLPDRVITATYLADSLRRWWRQVADELGSRPRSAAERIELEQLLRHDPQPVLELLRVEAEPLLLRTRIVADAVRVTRAVRSTTTNDTNSPLSNRPAAATTPTAAAGTSSHSPSSLSNRKRQP